DFPKLLRYRRIGVDGSPLTAGRCPGTLPPRLPGEPTTRRQTGSHPYETQGGPPMISRERIRAAINHQEPDKIPIDLAGYLAAGMAAIAYKNLRKYLNLEERPIRVYDPHQVLAVIDEDVMSRFGVDTVQAGRIFDHDDSCWKDGVLPDGTPCQYPIWASPEKHEGVWVLRSTTGKIVGHRPDGVLNFEPVNFPFAEHDSLTVKDIRAAIDNFQFTGVAGPYTA